MFEEAPLKLELTRILQTVRIALKLSNNCEKQLNCVARFLRVFFWRELQFYD